MNILIGKDLAGVHFVRDYVELHFDGPVIRPFYGPIAEIRGRKVPFPEPGSRDALCSLIGEKVREVVEREGISIELVFSSGNRIIVLLDDDHRVQGEALEFHPGESGSGIMVW